MLSVIILSVVADISNNYTHYTTVHIINSRGLVAIIQTNFLKGLFPALVTPFKPNEEIDDLGMSTLVNHLIGEGVDGFYVGGSSGEAMLLSLEERAYLLDTVIATVGGTVPVVAHIGCQRTSDTIRLAQHAALSGAAAISALPPIYYKYTLDELCDYYTAIMEAVELPFIVYNAPALTGIFFGPDNVGRIMEHKNACGMKFTSYDNYRLQRLISKYPDKVFINGHDETYLPTLAVGLDCAIGSTLNFMPRNFQLIRQSFAAGNMELARHVQDEVNQIVDCLIEVGVFRGLKGMLRLMGLPCGDCRTPFAPLTNDELRKLGSVLGLVHFSR